MYSSLCLGLLFAFGAMQLAPSAEELHEQSQMRTDDIIVRVRSLSPDEFVSYIRKLGEDKDAYALTAICRANFSLKGRMKGYDSSYAATVYCRTFDSDKAIAFCATLDLGSANWDAALFGLCGHGREKVIGYIRQVATSSEVRVRCRCYQICQIHGWDDLLKEAMSDLENDKPPNLPGLFEATVGEVAQRYVDAVQKRNKKGSD